MCSQESLQAGAPCWVFPVSVLGTYQTRSLSANVMKTNTTFPEILLRGRYKVKYPSCVISCSHHKDAWEAPALGDLEEFSDLPFIPLTWTLPASLNTAGGWALEYKPGWVTSLLKTHLRQRTGQDPPEVLRRDPTHRSAPLSSGLPPSSLPVSFQSWGMPACFSPRPPLS